MIQFWLWANLQPPWHARIETINTTIEMPAPLSPATRRLQHLPFSSRVVRPVQTHELGATQQLSLPHCESEFDLSKSHTGSIQASPVQPTRHPLSSVHLPSLLLHVALSPKHCPHSLQQLSPQQPGAQSCAMTLVMNVTTTIKHI